MSTQKAKFTDIILFLRWPLCVIILISHMSHIADTYSIYNSYLNVMIDSVSIFAWASVSLFFLFSGYLFFYRVKSVNLKLYINKFKSRIGSLLIPYFLWNLAILLLFCLFQFLMPSIFSGTHKSFFEYEVLDYAKAFFDYNDSGNPINAPLWFMKELMLCVISSPFIYFLLKYLKIIPIIALVLVIIFEIPYFTIGMLMFVIGVYLSMYQINIVKILDKITLISCLFLISFAISLYFLISGNIPIEINLINNVCFALWVFSLSNRVLSKGGGKLVCKLSGSSFFVYAVHYTPVILMCRLLPKLIPITNELIVTTLYVLFSVIFTYGFTKMYFIMERHLPRFTSLITGGR